MKLIVFLLTIILLFVKVAFAEDPFLEHFWESNNAYQAGQYLETKVALMKATSALLTANCVFIMGAENEFIPGIKLTPDNIRLFYVALTRSREKLFITSVRSRRTKLARGQYIRNPSVFINKILENVDQRYWKYEKL